MIRPTLFLVLALTAGAFAQQQATVSGTVTAPEALPETARVGVHIVDPQGVWGREIGGARPQNGTFSGQLESGDGFRSLFVGTVTASGHDAVSDAMPLTVWPIAVERSADAIACFAGPREADGYRRFCAHSRRTGASDPSARSSRCGISRWRMKAPASK